VNSHKKTEAGTIDWTSLVIRIQMIELKSAKKLTFLCNFGIKLMTGIW